MIEAIKQIDGYESMTPQQIADVLNASPLHKREIAITANGRANLLNLLTIKYGVLGQTPNQDWVGPLVTAEQSDTMTAQAMMALRPHLQVKDQFAEINQNVVLAKLFNHVVDVVAGLAVTAGTAESTQEVWEEVNKLSGGKLYAGILADGVQNALDLDAKQSIVSTTLQTINDAAQPAISKRNNATGWLDSLDTSEMTEAEVQSYCDDLVASSDGNPSGGE